MGRERPRLRIADFALGPSPRSPTCRLPKISKNSRTERFNVSARLTRAASAHSLRQRCSCFAEACRARTVDFGHPSRADEREDVVGAEATAGREGHL
jgi:hypothetical protein